MLEWSEYLKIFVALLSIVDPIGVVPIFISLTVGMGEKERSRIAWTTSIAVVVILAGAAVAGKLILEFFGISVASFRVGGGIIILMMSVSMMQASYLQSRQTIEEAREAEEKESIAVVPIAMPLLAGPAAISTIIIYSNTPYQPAHISIILVICILIGLVTLITMRIAYSVIKRMSKTSINIATRLLGLLLAAISIELIAGGLLQLFPGLGR